ncbi:5836_t:CDS:1, partial [Scutellospora calospora]
LVAIAFTPSQSRLISRSNVERKCTNVSIALKHSKSIKYDDAKE